MIQRLQTLYLAVIIIIVATLCTGSVIKATAIKDGITTEYNLNLFYYTMLQNGELKITDIQVTLIALVAVIIGISVAVIVSFKDRMRQIKLAKLNYVFMFVLLLAVMGKAMYYIPEFSFGKLFPYSLVGLLMMVFLVYMNWRAIRLIRKDDDLVKSADRIR